jgi:transcriptional regulator with XRE-family HTH domain
MILSARQIRTARTFLDWTQDDLASATGLNVSTIYKLESGKISPRGATNAAIHRAFDGAGLEISPDGLRMRPEDIMVVKGSDSCEKFLDDVLRVARQDGGEIICGFRSSALISHVFDFENGESERLERLCEIVPVKCLVGDVPGPLPVWPSFQVRAVPKVHIGPISYVEYGTRHALILIESPGGMTFVIFHLVGLAKSYKDHFLSVWENASPIMVSNRR